MKHTGSLRSASLLLASLAISWSLAGPARAQDVQTRLGPSGTVRHPGSQLLFVLDTGIRPDELGAFDPSMSLFQNFGITQSVFTNFVSVTNTHPDKAVTVQLGFYNERMEWVLDFLVLLSCNDTMTVDPFDYVIPGTAVDTAQVFFGNGGPSLSTDQFGNGTFLLAVTAVGAAGNEDSFRCDGSDPWSDATLGGGVVNWTLLPSGLVGAASQQLVLASAKDDYNGSLSGDAGLHPQVSVGAGESNSSYALSPAATRFQLSVYDNDEGVYPLLFEIGVVGLDVFRSEEGLIPGPMVVPGGRSPDRVFTAELTPFSLSSVLGLTPGGELGTFLGPVPVNDELGPGLVRLTSLPIRDYYYFLDGSVTATAVPYDGERGSYLFLARPTALDPALAFSFLLGSQKAEMAEEP